MSSDEQVERRVATALCAYQTTGPSDTNSCCPQPMGEKRCQVSARAAVAAMGYATDDYCIAIVKSLNCRPDDHHLNAVRLTHGEWFKACSAVAAMDEWRPIESAPKDETIIQVFGVWAGEINGPDKEPDIYLANWQGGRTDYEGYTWNVIGTDAYAAWVKATHGMPLPTPPVTS